MDERFDDVRESFGRATLDGDLMQTFLDILVGSHPAIGAYFKHVDLERLKSRLVESVHIAILCAEDVPVGRAGINRLAKLHGSMGLDVNPDLYVFWIESFMRAISYHDPEFTDEIKLGWRTVLKKTTSLMAPSTTFVVA